MAERPHTHTVQQAGIPKGDSTQISYVWLIQTIHFSGYVGLSSLTIQE